MTKPNQSELKILLETLLVALVSLCFAGFGAFILSKAAKDDSVAKTIAGAAIGIATIGFYNHVNNNGIGTDTGRFIEISDLLSLSNNRLPLKPAEEKQTQVEVKSNPSQIGSVDDLFM